MNNVIERIKLFNADRDPDYLPLKYKAMSQSPFRFFRGTCHLFYEDFIKAVKWEDTSRVWICGDLHLENYGTYKGDNGLVYFDMNDFDEAILAPATWEIARTVTSIYLAAIDLKLTSSKTDIIANNFLDTYISVLQKGTSFALNQEKKKAIQQFFEEWSNQHHPKKYNFIDSAYRMAGTGSIGIARYVMLLQKRKDQSYVLVDMKQAKVSSLRPYIKFKQPKWNNEAERVVDIQKMVQYVSPAFIKPVLFEQTYFVLKQLQPMADKMDLALCKGKLNKLEIILQTMAEVAASGQLRSSGRRGSSTADELITLANHHKQWRNALLSFAKQYAKQVEADYKIFCNSALLK